MKNRNSNRGFTLIELMITVAIVGILASIAYPAYDSYVLRTRRAVATGCLLELTQQMERRYTEKLVYNVPTTLPGVSCATDITSYYTLRFLTGQPTASTYTVEADPIGNQANDGCGTLSVNERGVKTQATGTPEKCWRK
jgi:type IV pilus assembly protein PilE